MLRGQPFYLQGGNISLHPTGGPRTTLKFNCLDMFGITAGHKDYDYYQERDSFKRLLNRSLELYSGDRVAHIEMQCCLAREFTSGFSHWLHSISRLGVERLHLFFECVHLHPHDICSSKLITFSLDTLSHASSLKYFYLSYCVLLTSPKVHLNSLIALSLHGVVLESVHLKGIMSSCSNLKELQMMYCKLPYKLRLDGTVTLVVMEYCSGAENIDHHAAYIHTIKCKMENKVRFRFSFVPVLLNVMVWLKKAPSNKSCIFRDCARYLPPQVIYFPKMFRYLRELRLMLMNAYDILEIVDLSTLWSACPLLEDLDFTISTDRIIEDEIRRRMLPSSPMHHAKLKHVTYNGFYGTESEVELALYILRNAIVLERMFLSPTYKGYFGFGSNLNVSLDETKRNLIQQKLHGQAISREAVVIIQ